MAELTRTRELSRLLMAICDQNLQYLRGAVAAADGLCEGLFEEAEAAS
jgi:hypothetical protein